MSGLHKKTIYEVLGRGPAHPFPARMSPGLAMEFVSRSNQRLRVLDPMMGSGTVLAIARQNGHSAIGFDIDPLAVLISNVWTTPLDHAVVRRRAAAVLANAEKCSETMRIRDAYPKRADTETRKFVRYWFDRKSRVQLTSLAAAIHAVRDCTIRNALWCSFSRLIITKQAGASLAKDLAHSRPHKSFETAPISVFKSFLPAVERVLESCLSSSARANGPGTTTALGDARELRLPDACVDVVLTSPPYLNAIDYMRCSKFSLVWMGHQIASLRELRKRSVGTEVGQYSASSSTTKIVKRLSANTKLSPRHKAVLARFVEDMIASLREVNRVLVPGGKAIYVIGENCIRGNYIANSRILIAAAHTVGLVLEDRSSRTLPPNRRYLPPPSTNKKNATLDARMRREVVLSFRKSYLSNFFASEQYSQGRKANHGRNCAR